VLFHRRPDLVYCWKVAVAFENPQAVGSSESHRTTFWSSGALPGPVRNQWQESCLKAPVKKKILQVLWSVSTRWLETTGTDLIVVNSHGSIPNPNFGVQAVSGSYLSYGMIVFCRSLCLKEEITLCWEIWKFRKNPRWARWTLCFKFSKQDFLNFWNFWTCRKFQELKEK